MPRARISTTVDEGLLVQARDACGGPNDAALIDAALRALLARHRRSEIDAAYQAYDEHPLEEPDEWGDLSSFRAAAASS
ncbi:MAG: type II toxin-antitoxin system VapB family antitoxin [Acidimicrobiales bacterium]